MTCRECQIFQEGNKTSFFRWKNTDIEIRACNEHLKEVFEVLRNAQKEGEMVE